MQDFTAGLTFVHSKSVGQHTFICMKSMHFYAHDEARVPIASFAQPTFVAIVGKFNYEL